MSKGIGKKVKVKGREGTITGSRIVQNGPKAGETEWKVKTGKAEGKWYPDSQVTEA